MLLKLTIFLCIFISCEIGTDTISSGNVQSEIKFYKENNSTLTDTSLMLGDSLLIIAKYFRNNIPLSVSDFIWQSNNSSVVNVTNSGKIKAISTGQTTISATYKNSSMNLLVSVVNSELDLAKIIINSPFKTTFNTNDTLSLSAKSFSINESELFGKIYTWSSSNNAIASITDAGFLTFLQAGSVSVRANSGGIFSSSLLFSITDLNQSRSGAIEPVSHGNSHKGTATLKYISGVLTLVLESDFQTVSGPDLHVTLASKKTDYSAGDIDLGALKATSGMQTYSIPSNIKIGDFAYIQVWCKSANSVFCTAALN